MNFLPLITHKEFFLQETPVNCAVADTHVRVFNGIDILKRDNFSSLTGLKIGLVTNQTGRDLCGKLTIDILKKASNVMLVALFSPEHGIRGLADENVDDSIDEKTGLPIYSLYGQSQRPKPEQLKDIDAVVYDIQDVGTRFYTYIATLRNVLEEAVKASKQVFILDRPNPLNGVSIEGPLAEEDKLSFMAAHTIPVRYAMTIGELGTMMNAEQNIGADLHVIKMEGWSRSMWFDATAITWVNPSPNIRSLNQAILYTGIGLLETTNVSVGRGTDTPFELVGAPWIDAKKLVEHLNSSNLKGVKFTPAHFKPNASTYKDEECQGVHISLIERHEFNSVRIGLEIATALRDFYPSQWQIERYMRLLVSEKVFSALIDGHSAEKIEEIIDFDTFLYRRSHFLLYT